MAAFATTITSFLDVLIYFSVAPSVTKVQFSAATEAIQSVYDICQNIMLRLDCFDKYTIHKFSLMTSPDSPNPAGSNHENLDPAGSG